MPNMKQLGMPSCERVSQLVSQGHDRALSWRERARLLLAVRSGALDGRHDLHPGGGGALRGVWLSPALARLATASVGTAGLPQRRLRRSSARVPQT